MIKNLTSLIYFISTFAFLGILSLIFGPSRWFANYAKSIQINPSTESYFQIGIIILIGIISFFLTIKLQKYLSDKSQKLKTKTLIFFSLLLISTLVIFSFKPEFLQLNQTNENLKLNDATFIKFGNYPTEELIIQLKKENYTGIISLLHPMVVPAEPILIEKEEKLCKKHNIKLISIPMLPWISNNNESLKLIEKIAQTKHHKYYVHCYLGRDRAGIFKQYLQKINNNIILTENKKNLINPKIPFERGEIYILKKNIFLTPYPTDEELFHYVLNSDIKTVVNLMNPKVSEENKFINKQKEIIENHKMRFYNLPINENDSEAKILDIIKQFEKMERPILINAFSASHKNYQNFLKVYQNKH